MNAQAPKKMRAEKFDPLPVDESDELFPNGIFEFNVSKLLSFMGENSDRFPVEEVDVAPLAVGPTAHLDEVTIETADLSNPIVLAEISPGRFNVIDGNHRLERAHRMGLKTIPARRILAQQHLAFLTSEKAYSSYIRYWNIKVEDLE